MIMTEKEDVKAESIKLLIIDDEVGFVNIMTKRLRKRNMDVTPANSGTEAMQLIRKHDFDVALLDLKMVDMDGIEVLKIFKKAYPEMEVIMLTGHGSEQAAREGIELGAFDYLSKPCELEELIVKIKEAYKKKKGELKL